MKLQDFIEQFMHNNEVYIENRDNYCMQYSFLPGEPLRDMIMDWEVGRYTDIRDCEVICIKNVLRPRKQQGITIKIDTDRQEFSFVKDTVTMHNAPLWLFEKMHGKTVPPCGCDAEECPENECCKCQTSSAQEQ